MQQGDLNGGAFTRPVMLCADGSRVCRISITQQVEASNINIHLDHPTALTEQDHKAVVQQVVA